VKSPFDAIIAEMLILKTNKKFPLIQGVGIQRTPNTVPTMLNALGLILSYPYDWTRTGRVE
jgi:hypothetical protein